MPTAKKLPSGSWRCQVFSHYEEVRQPDGSCKKKRIYKSFTCDDSSRAGKKKCELMATEWSAQKREHNCNITVAEALERYISSKKDVLSPSTLRVYRGMQKNHYDSIAGKKLDDLTSEIMQNWINSISSSSPKTVRNSHALLFSAITMFLPSARFNTILPQRKRPDLYIPTDEDIRRLIEYVKGREIELAIYLAAFGPMRRGEICALTSDDIHGNSVYVSKSMVLGPEKNWIIKQPKTYASYREIQFPPFVIAMLRQKSGRIFDMNPGELSSRFQRAVYYAGLPHFRFHDLRHYSASLMHAQGIPDVYIMQRGGWTTDHVMKTVYRHTLADRTESMNQKVNHLVGEVMQHEVSHEK